MNDQNYQSPTANTPPPENGEPTSAISKRTAQQNKALHLLFQMIADELNESGLDMRKALRPEVDIPWTKETIKEYIWRPVMESQLMKKSTTELTTTEVDQVFETINRFLAVRYQVHVPFPTIDELIYEQNL